MRSGSADLSASVTPGCSAVEVLCVPGDTDFLKGVPDSSAMVSGPGAIPMRGNAGDHVPRTADVGGELFGLGAGANLLLCPDHAATAGSSSTRSCRSRWLCCRFFGARVSSRLRRDILLLLLVFVLWGQELTLANTEIVQLLLGADVFSFCSQTCMPPVDRHRLVSDVVHGRCTSLAPLGTN